MSELDVRRRVVHAREEHPARDPLEPGRMNRVDLEQAVIIRRRHRPRRATRLARQHGACHLELPGREHAGDQVRPARTRTTTNR